MITHKPELLLGTRKLTEIHNCDAQAVNGEYSFISDYDKYYDDKMFREIVLSGLSADQIYIRRLHVLVGYLYDYYELNRRFFDLLDCLAQNLERYYGKEIERFSADADKVQEIRTEMAKYLNKVALIFDIAANRLDVTKEGGAALKATYELKAQIYSEKADDVFGVAKTEAKSRTARMLDLYQKAISEFHPCDFFLVREPFLEMVRVYQRRLEEETKEIPELVGDETVRLLASAKGAADVPRVASDGVLTKFWKLFSHDHARGRSQSAPARPEAAPERKTSDEVVELFADSLRQRRA